MTEKTCTRAEPDAVGDDVVEDYAAGRLSDAEAEAFEAHYFECDACWGRVRRALELHAAFADRRPSRPVAAGASTGGRTPRFARFPRLSGVVAAAAAIAVLLVGVTLVGRLGDDTPSPGEWRGPGATVALRAAIDDGAVRGTWAPVADADVYRIRLYRPDGTPVAEAETGDTVAVLALDDRASLAGDDTLYLEVEALGPLRDVLARSELVPLAGPVGPVTEPR